MHQITSSQFQKAIELDPAWASKLTEPVEITDYCAIYGSEITHLSPLLHFTGKDKDGNSASFYLCKSLKIAEGNFEGFVSFSCSSIEKIGDLTCRKDSDGNSATFWHCKSLKVAEGKFEGLVRFSESAIEKIGDLTCGKNEEGDSASFVSCESLKIAEGKFEGAVCFYESGIEKIGDLSCGKNNKGIRLDVRNCPNLKSIPFTLTPEGIEADCELLKNLTETRAFIQKKRAEIMEIII